MNFEGLVSFAELAQVDLRIPLAEAPLQFWKCMTYYRWRAARKISQLGKKPVPHVTDSEAIIYWKQKIYKNK